MTVHVSLFPARDAPSSLLATTTQTATLSNNISCTYIPVGWDDCDQTICTDSDNDGNCDFDEPAGCCR